MTRAEQLREEAQSARTALYQFMQSRKSSTLDDFGQPVLDADDADAEHIRNQFKKIEDLEAEAKGAELSEIASKVRTDLTHNRTPRGNFGDTVGANGGMKMDGTVDDPRSLYERMIQSPQFKNRSQRKFDFEISEFDAIRMTKTFGGGDAREQEYKTLMSLGNSSYTPPNYRTNIVSYFPVRRPVIGDLIPTDPTTNQITKFMRGTTQTLAAETVSEAAAKPESALVFTEVTCTVGKIAHIIPITEEQLDDIPSLRNIIDNLMVLGLLLKEEEKILFGSGEIVGLANTSNVQTQTQGTDTILDAIFKAITKVLWTGFASVSGVLIHPNDFQTIRLLKDSQNRYIWGEPSTPGPDTIWGYPMVKSPVVGLGRPWVGDFATQAHISRRMEARVDVSDNYNDYFAKNMLMIRAEMRESFEVYRPSAFCYVT